MVCYAQLFDNILYANVYMNWYYSHKLNYEIIMRKIVNDH